MSEPARTGTGRMAGLSVVRYREIDSHGTVTEVAYAPQAGCEIMERTTTYSGSLGIPGARRSYAVTSYRAGEPSRELFVLPAGYAVKKPQTSH